MVSDGVLMSCFVLLFCSIVSNYASASVCIDSSCPSFSKCKPNYDKDDYSCHCDPGYVNYDSSSGKIDLRNCFEGCSKTEPCNDELYCVIENNGFGVCVAGSRTACANNPCGPYNECIPHGYTHYTCKCKHKSTNYNIKTDEFIDEKCYESGCEEQCSTQLPGRTGECQIHMGKPHCLCKFGFVNPEDDLTVCLLQRNDVCTEGHIQRRQSDGVSYCEVRCKVLCNGTYTTGGCAPEGQFTHQPTCVCKYGYSNMNYDAGVAYHDQCFVNPCDIVWNACPAGTKCIAKSSKTAICEEVQAEVKHVNIKLLISILVIIMLTVNIALGYFVYRCKYNSANAEMAAPLEEADDMPDTGPSKSPQPAVYGSK